LGRGRVGEGVKGEDNSLSLWERVGVRAKTTAVEMV
jgi:hypothetical protein